MAIGPSTDTLHYMSRYYSAQAQNIKTKRLNFVLFIFQMQTELTANNVPTKFRLAPHFRS